MLIFFNLFLSFLSTLFIITCLDCLYSKHIHICFALNQVFSGKELFEIDADKLKKVIDDCYCKHVSVKENKLLYDEISSLLGMYVYVKDKINIKPYIIIGKNL